MGIFSAIGTALKNPDVQDRLAAIGATLQGDTNAAQAYQHRSAQRTAAEDTAAKLEALAQAEAAGNLPQLVAPQLGSNLAALPADGPVSLPAPPGPISVSQLPPLPQRPAEAMPAVAPVAAPVTPLAPATPARRSIYAEMLPQLIRASGRGADVSGLLSTLQAEDYIRGLPQKDQATARAAGVGNFANWENTNKRPIEMAPGGRLVQRGDDDSYREVFSVPSLPAKPEPVTMDRLTAQAWATPPEQRTADQNRLVRRYEAGSDGFYGERAPPRLSYIERLAEIRANGGTLDEAQQEYWDANVTRRGAGAGGGGLGGYGGGAAYAPATPPAAAPAARPAAAAKPAAKPKTLDAAAIQKQFPGAQKAKDGFWYVRKGNQYFRVNP